MANQESAGYGYSKEPFRTDTRVERPVPQERQLDICVRVDGFKQGQHDDILTGMVVSPASLAGSHAAFRLMTPQEARQGYAREMSDAEFDKRVLQRVGLYDIRVGYQGQGSNGRRFEVPQLPRGSHMMLYGALHAADLTSVAPYAFKAQYAESFGRGHVPVISGMGRISVRQTEREPVVTLDMLYPNKASTIKTLDDVARMYEEHMQVATEHNARMPTMLFRLYDKYEESKAWTTWAFPAHQRQEVRNNNGGTMNLSLPASPERSFNQAMETDGRLQFIGALLSDDVLKLVSEEAKIREIKRARVDLFGGKIGIEAIPGERFPIVGYGKTAVLSGTGPLGRAYEDMKMQRERDGRIDVSVGFLPVTVALKPSKSNSPDIPPSFIVTKINADPTCGISAAAMNTENYISPTAVKIQEMQDAHAYRAAKNGGVPVASGDMPSRSSPDAGTRQQSNQPEYGR